MKTQITQKLEFLRKSIYLYFNLQKMNQLASPLSNVQIELLKLYSTNLLEKDLLELKSTLAKFYAERSIRLADKIWDERELTNEDMNRWLNED